MKKQIRYSFILILSLLLLQNPAIAKPEQVVTIKSGIYSAAFQKYQHYLEGDVCKQLKPNFAIEQIDRLIVDLLITCLAFKQQNVAVQFEIIPFPNNIRALKMVANGLIDTIVPAIWQDDATSTHFFVSQEVVRKGEYEKGVYVYEHHPLLKAEPQQIDLAGYRGLVVKSWHHDLQLMNQLTNEIVYLSHIPSINQMLKAQRADFVLSHFPKVKDHVWSLNDITLRPILGVKVVINHSRHFVASKHTKLGLFYMQTLQNGIKQLRQQGTISKLYIESGFINPAFKDWRVLAR